MRLSFFIYLALFGLGIFLSEALVGMHIQAHLGGGDSGLCAASAGFSCVDVANSNLSAIFGIPIASLGLAFYIVGLCLALIHQFFPKLIEGLADVFVTAGLSITCYSVFLGIASTIFIGKICPYCFGLYAVNIALFVTAVRSHPEDGVASLKRAHHVFKTPGLWAAVVLLALAIPTTQFTYTRQAEAAITAAKAKKKAAKPKGRVEVKAGKSPARGVETATVTIVEFSDFECPYCKKLGDNLKAAMALAPGLFKYHFKHYPMDNDCNREMDREMHQHACQAALGMVCADRVGRGWQMHDRLFDNQSSLSKKAIAAIAASIGVDVERFSACMESPEAMAVVKRDVEEGIQLGVQGTPTWFINGIQQVGAIEPDEIVTLVHQAQRDLENKAAKPDAQKEDANSAQGSDSK